jgi:dimeric dUTPase (all-alpha-NTP-PPase superfamily)
MAEAAALSKLDTANLNNRQQAAVQNAQSFLQVDMANLANHQQTDCLRHSKEYNQCLLTKLLRMLLDNLMHLVKIKLTNSSLT